MTRKEQQEQLNALYTALNNGKAELTTYDYIGTKIAMGVAKKTDYTEQIARTEEIRVEIRRIQGEVEELESITEFDPDEDIPHVEESVQ